MPVGDGILLIDQLQYAPVSTVLGATILQALFAEIIELMHKQGASLPVFGSSNVGKTDNDVLIEQYGRRIHF